MNLNQILFQLTYQDLKTFIFLVKGREATDNELSQLAEALENEWNALLFKIIHKVIA